MRVFLLMVLFSTCANANVVCKTKLQKYYMMKIYDITLCKDNNTDYDGIFQSSFSIALSYKMASSSSWIGSRSLHEINKHYKLTEMEKQYYKKYFDGFFPSVKRGDEIKMVFTPNYGAKFYFNGKLFGEIAEITFAIRTANIWLHPSSTFKDTRDFLFQNG